MADFTRKLIFKTASYLLIFVFLSLSVLVIFVNIYLSFSKNKIQEYLSSRLGYKAYVTKVRYLPPSSLIFSRILFTPQDKNFANGFFVESLEKLNVSFSAADFLLRKKWNILNIHIVKPNVIICDRAILFNPVMILENFSFIMPGNFIKTKIISGFLTVLGMEGFGVFDADAKISSDKFFSSRGSFVFMDSRRDKNFDIAKIGQGHKFLYFNTNGYFKHNGINIESLELDMEGFYSKLWGDIDGSRARFNGILSLKGFIFDRGSGLLKATDRPQNLQIYTRQSPYVMGKGAMNFFDLDCSLNFYPDGFQVENLSFSFNDTPLAIKGYVHINKDCDFDMNLSSYPRELPPARAKRADAFDIEAKGTMSRGKFSGNIALLFGGNKPLNRRISMVKCDFSDLYFRLLPTDDFTVFFNKANFSIVSDSRESQIPFSNFMAIIYLNTKKFKFASSVCEGFLQAEGRYQRDAFPYIKLCTAKLRGINISKFKNFSTYFEGVEGLLSADVIYKNLPSAYLRARVNLTDGFIYDRPFLLWLCDFFAYGAFKSINFTSLSCDAIFTDRVRSLASITLNSDDLKFKGSLDIDKNNLAKGGFSLSLSKKIISESSRFRPLLKLIKKDARFVDFDFKLSGALDSLNFKWLESDFKARLKGLLPQGMEDAFDTVVEEAMQEINKAQSEAHALDESRQ